MEEEHVERIAENETINQWLDLRNDKKYSEYFKLVLQRCSAAAAAAAICCQLKASATSGKNRYRY